jgi:ABC-2 type transport system permease protein
MLINPISFKTLIRREIIRFSRIINQTILSPVLSSFLYLLIFGSTIGKNLSMAGNISYIAFLVPGIVIMNIINVAYSHTSFSIFYARYTKMIENELITPISNFEKILASTIGAFVVSAIVGGLICLISLIFSPLSIHNFAMFIFFFISISVTFANFGILVALMSEQFEHLSFFTTYLITPLTFLGGVFYSVSMLPEKLLLFTKINPFFYMVDGFRWSMIGYSEGNLALSIVLSFMLAVSFFFLSVWLFHIGFKMKH